MQIVSFQNCAPAVISFIDATKHSLLVGMCWFTHPAIFQAVQQACSRNVKVKIILNYDQINFQPRGLDFLSLERNGAAVMAYTGQGLWHYKFAVADSSRVLTGSYNWTNTEHCDYVAIMQDAALAAQFTLGIEALSTHCHPLGQLKDNPVRHITFTQLYRPALWRFQDLRKSVVTGAKVWLVVAKKDNDWLRWQSQQRHCLSVKHPAVLHIFREIWDKSSFRIKLIDSGVRGTVRLQLIRYCLRVQPGDIFVAVTPTGIILGVGIVGSNPEISTELPETVSCFVQWLGISSPKLPSIIKLPSGKPGIIRYTGSGLALIASFESAI